MTRIAHIGNIASNAFLNAKFQRRLGVEADSFDLGGGNPQWLPWWEEADLDVGQLESPGGWYDWLAVAESTGVARPRWAKILGADGAAPWYDTQEDYQGDLARWLPSVMPMSEEGRRRHSLPAVRTALTRSPLTAAEQEACAGVLSGLPAWRSILALAKVYDLLVFYGPHASYGCVLPTGTPYVTFEHSTMRLIPWLDQPEYHSLAAAYRHASANIITNADCGESAWMLGLDNCTFIPHPLDHEMFSPEPTGGDEEARSVRQRLEENIPGGFDALLFAPARQSRSARTGAKRNDRIFYALRRYVDEQEPRGAPRLALVAGAWGTGPDVQASAKLVYDLELTGRVVWLSAQAKRRMVALYRACDVVLDQFSEQVGSFGTVTAEAMSCAKPVITYINPEAHDWCLHDGLGGSLPPVANARTADDVYELLVRLVDREHGLERRQKLGAKARAWIERVHGWRVTTERSLDLYARVLGVSRADLVTQPVGEPVELPLSPLVPAASAEPAEPEADDALVAAG